MHTTTTARAIRETITLALRDAGTHADVPFPIRLRRFLKAALRSYGLRCVAITDAPGGNGEPRHIAAQPSGAAGLPVAQQRAA